MNVLHFDYDNPLHPAIAGGGAIRNFEIYSRFPSDVNINIMTSVFGEDCESIQKENVYYHRVSRKYHRIINRLAYTCDASHRAQSLLKNTAILVDDFTPFSPLCMRVPLHVPALAVVQNYFGIESFKKYQLMGIGPFIMEKTILRRYSNFIAVSECIKNKLLGMHKKISNIVVIPNGIDESLLHVEDTPKDFILFLGRLDIYQKGLDILLDVFSEFVKKHVTMRLLIAGDGREKTEIENRISRLGLSKHVVLCGKVGMDEKIRLLSECCFMVMPSRYESWGISALEASAAGKAVVGFDIDGLNYVIKKGKTGVLVDRENPKELLQALRGLVDNHNLCASLGAAGREWARGFTWDKISCQQLAFYKYLIEEHRKV